MTNSTRPLRALLLAILLAAGSASAFYAARTLHQGAILDQAPFSSAKLDPSSHQNASSAAQPSTVSVPANSNLEVSKAVVAGGGGGPSTGGTSQVEGTVGQTATSISSGGTFTLSSGFWPSIGCQANALQPSALPEGTAGIGYTQQLSLPGGLSNVSFVLASGRLPSGLSLTETGELKGAPLEIGNFNFTIKATDALNCIVSTAYALRIKCPTVSLSPAILPGWQVGVSYSQALAASPTGSYTYSLLTGSLPPGLTLNTTNGQITGTTTVIGTYNFTIRALGAGSCSGTQSFSLAINCPLAQINPVTLPGGTVGTAYNQSLNATPAGNYSFSRSSGSLPPGLTLSSAGALSGTPTTQGSYTFTVQATGFSICTGSRTYTLTISASCTAITLATLPSGKLNVHYYGNLATTTPSGSYTFTVDSGALPPGLALDNLFAALVGKPTVAGTYNFTLKATRSNGCTGTRAYTLTISGSSLLARRNDFDGDGKSDPVLREAGSGVWRLTLSSTGHTEAIQLGSASDLPAPGDYDGDGRTDAAAYRPAEAFWLIRLSSTGEITQEAFGFVSSEGLVPVAADYDGDGRTDLALWENATATWHLRRSSDGKQQTWQFGTVGDVAVPADYDGDGKADLAVFERSTAHWRVQQSSDGAELSHQFGNPKDEPLVGDYDGDGRADLGVWRGAETVLYLKHGSTQQVFRVTVELSSPADWLLSGDYDGDGKTEIAVWRAHLSKWLINPGLLR
jgi:hypothetical protein